MAARTVAFRYIKVGDVQMACQRDHCRRAQILHAIASPWVESGWRNPIQATPSGGSRSCGDLRPGSAAHVGRARRPCLGALKSYRDGLAIFDWLAQSDPGLTPAGSKNLLSVTYRRGSGGLQLAQGDITGAVQSYHDSLTIRDRLAQSDSNNAGWRTA